MARRDVAAAILEAHTRWIPEPEELKTELEELEALGTEEASPLEEVFEGFDLAMAQRHRETTAMTTATVITSRRS